jgi:hypothetical protein
MIYTIEKGKTINKGELYHPSRPILLHLPCDVLQALDALSCTSKTARCVLIRQILTQHLQHQNKAATAFQRLLVAT